MKIFVVALFAVTACAGRVVAPSPIWHDEFDGPAGTSFDRAKWVVDTGGHGFGNQERQFYNNTPRERSPGRPRPPGDHGARRAAVVRVHVLVRELSVHVDATQDQGAVRAGVRPLRGTHPRPARAGHLARLLDARREH